MIRRPPRSTHCISSAASDVYKRQVIQIILNLMKKWWSGQKESGDTLRQKITRSYLKITCYLTFQLETWQAGRLLLIKMTSFLQLILQNRMHLLIKLYVIRSKKIVCLIMSDHYLKQGQLVCVLLQLMYKRKILLIYAGYISPKQEKYQLRKRLIKAIRHISKHLMICFFIVIFTGKYIKKAMFMTDLLIAIKQVKLKLIKSLSELRSASLKANTIFGQICQKNNPGITAISYRHFAARRPKDTGSVYEIKHQQEMPAARLCHTQVTMLKRNKINCKGKQ
eukprot:TRINITY_DN845_c0_g1_i1.p2 TRINITY_DN845_c0_g1~~TRINITY_DN845_c0_g1_i1.p2  ORF type:complete len:280 (+),score=13.42 TRINITY_DN845_c0_g1_i1:127-966(+)